MQLISLSTSKRYFKRIFYLNLKILQRDEGVIVSSSNFSFFLGGALTLYLSYSSSLLTHELFLISLLLTDHHTIFFFSSHFSSTLFIFSFFLSFLLFSLFYNVSHIHYFYSFIRIHFSFINLYFYILFSFNLFIRKLLDNPPK